jgi:aryl carrier-like protein
VSGGLGQSAFRAEKRLKSITIVMTGLVERLRAKHVGVSLKISAIKAKIVPVGSEVSVKQKMQWRHKWRHANLNCGSVCFDLFMAFVRIN